MFWWILCIIVFFCVVRYLSFANLDAQHKHTAAMETQCLKDTVDRVPMKLVLVGHSSEVAHFLFEILHKSQCPRRLRVHVLEYWTVGSETAAIQYDRAVRLRGLYDSSFDEQIEWRQFPIGHKDEIRPLSDLVVVNRASDHGCPLMGLIVAHESLHWTLNWDTLVFEGIQSLRTDDSILTGIPAEYSRIDTTHGSPRIEWIPWQSPLQSRVPVVFPGPAIFGTATQMSRILEAWHREWSMMPLKLFPIMSGFMTFQWEGLLLLQRPPIIQDKPWWTTPSSTIVEEFSRRYRNEDLIGERHCLGLDPETASTVETIVKYGSLHELQRAIAYIRS